MEVLLTLAPLLLSIRRLGEHGLVKPYDLPLFVIRLLQSLLHGCEQRIITTISPFDRHFCYVDDLALDQVLLVYHPQTPWLDEPVRPLSMEKHTTLLNASRDPRLKGRFGSEIVDVLLVKNICTCLFYLRSICNCHEI